MLNKVSDFVQQEAYDNLLAQNNMESEVGYRVRLWILFLSSLCLSREDRSVSVRFYMLYPGVSPSQIQPVSSTFVSIFLVLRLTSMLYFL